MAAVSIVDKIT